MCFGGKQSSSTASAAAPAVAVATKSRSSSAQIKKNNPESTASDTLLPESDGAAPAATTGNQDAATVGGVQQAFLTKKRKSGLGL